MSFSSFEVGAVNVTTTQNIGHDPDFWAEQATKRIVSIGGNCHPIIAQQAEAFQRSGATADFILYERGDQE